MDELKKRNPADEKGNRKHKHFQLLTPSQGYVHLLKHLGYIQAIMEKHNSWQEALHEIDQRFPSVRDPYLQLNVFDVADKTRFKKAVNKASQPKN